jgi:hypothetical protein
MAKGPLPVDLVAMRRQDKLFHVSAGRDIEKDACGVVAGAAYPHLECFVRSER